VRGDRTIAWIGAPMAETRLPSKSSITRRTGTGAGPSTPEIELLLWMALFFDAPLAGPAPSDRRGLVGKETTR
jgi:hypothetical protein